MGRSMSCHSTPPSPQIPPFTQEEVFSYGARYKL